MWGMALTATCVVFLAPLIYIQNKEFIDEHVTHASNVITEQASQVKDLTAQHTSNAFESVKGYTGDYASKASEMVGTARQKIPLPATTKVEPVRSTDFPTATTKTEPVRSADFPTAPNSDLPAATGLDTTKPVIHEPVAHESVGETVPTAAY